MEGAAPAAPGSWEVALPPGAECSGPRNRLASPSFPNSVWEPEQGRQPSPTGAQTEVGHQEEMGRFMGRVPTPLLARMGAMNGACDAVRVGQPFLAGQITMPRFRGSPQLSPAVPTGAGLRLIRPASCASAGAPSVAGGRSAEDRFPHTTPRGSGTSAPGSAGASWG